MTFPSLPAQNDTNWYAHYTALHNATLGQVPAHAGPRAKVYDSQHSIYNLKASNTRRLRAAWSAAEAGAQLCRIAFNGDSLTRGGSGGPLGTTDPVSLFRIALGRRGYTGVGELVHPYTGTVTDPRLVTAGTWTSGDNTFPWIYSSSTGATATLTGTGTVLEIVAHTANGPFTIAIDGGTAAAYTGAGGATIPEVITITGLANTTHTAVITVTGTSNVFLYAAGFRATTGFVVENVGLSGATASQWNFSTGAAWVQEMLPFHLDCVVLELGANEFFTAVPAATFGTNLQSLVQRFKATGATVVLVASQYPAGADATWPAYVSAVYDVADAENLPLIDLADRFGLFTQYNADGLTYDQADDALVHLNPAGNAHMARAWMHALTA